MENEESKEKDIVKKVIISKEEMDETIDTYIMGKPIEKAYVIIRHGDSIIDVVLRIPTAKMMDIGNRLLYMEKDLAAALAFNNSNLMGILISRYLNKDFAKDQGDKYDTAEGLEERISYLQLNILSPVRDRIVDKCKEFQSWYEEIFSQENLENF